MSSAARDPEDDVEGGRRGRGRGTRGNRKKRHSPIQPAAMELGHIEPKTANQRRAFRAWDEGKHLMLHGCAGTGKTLIALYLGLDEVVTEHQQTRVVLVRSAVPTRDQGFMPGNLKEKSQYYELPFMSACSDIYGRGDAYGALKGKGTIEFITTSYIRGVTLHDAIIIIDEVQNLSLHEIDSVITRCGHNSRLIVMGDFRQSDFTRTNERDGVKKFMQIAKSMGSFEFIEFTHDDILRSDVVKEYIVARDNLGILE